MAPNYMPSMNFFYRLIAIFSLLGLANGLLFMASIRTRQKQQKKREIQPSSIKRVQFT